MNVVDTRLDLRKVSYFSDGSSGFAARRAHTKSVGDRSEAEAILALLKAGYLVAKPFGENQRYDLIIDDGARLARVQVKTGRLRLGAILYNTYSAHSHRGGPSCRTYRGAVDFYAVYCPQTGKVYLVPESECSELSGTLRVEPSRNNQRRKIRWASKFELA